MAKKVILSREAPAPLGAYSQGIQAGGFIFLSGQIPLDPKTSQPIPGTFQEQVQRILENLGAVLRAAGADYKDVVRATVYLTDMTDFPALNEVYAKFFPTEPPARTTIQVAGLPRGASVEIDCVAHVG